MSLIVGENVNITFAQFNSFKAVSLTMLKSKLNTETSSPHKCLFSGTFGDRAFKTETKRMGIKQPSILASFKSFRSPMLKPRIISETIYAGLLLRKKQLSIKEKRGRGRKENSLKLSNSGLHKALMGSVFL